MNQVILRLQKSTVYNPGVEAGIRIRQNDIAVSEEERIQEESGRNSWETERNEISSDESFATEEADSVIESKRSDKERRPLV